MVKDNTRSLIKNLEDSQNDHFYCDWRHCRHDPKLSCFEFASLTHRQRFERKVAALKRAEAPNGAK